MDLLPTWRLPEPFLCESVSPRQKSRAWTP